MLDRPAAPLDPALEPVSRFLSSTGCAVYGRRGEGLAAPQGLGPLSDRGPAVLGRLTDFSLPFNESLPSVTSILRMWDRPTIVATDCGAGLALGVLGTVRGRIALRGRMIPSDRALDAVTGCHVA